MLKSLPSELLDALDLRSKQIFNKSLQELSATELDVVRGSIDDDANQEIRESAFKEISKRADLHKLERMERGDYMHLIWGHFNTVALNKLEEEAKRIGVKSASWVLNHIVEDYFKLNRDESVPNPYRKDVRDSKE